jgi:anaerobic selenocysteine-containing dehydrogenase
VRALLSLGGSPATAWPDQTRTVEALRKLELLVHTDIHMSPTAKLATYVIACRLPFELPATTMLSDFVSQFGVGWGYRRPHAQYTPAIVEPPPGSGVIAQWELLYRLAKELGLPIEVVPGVGRGGQPERAGGPMVLDGSHDPTSDELLEMVHSGSRIPLDEIKRHPGGALFDDAPVAVAPQDPGWTGRLDVGNPHMLRDLVRELEDGDEPAQGRAFPFRLLVRRAMHVMNTPVLAYPSNRPRHNPAFLHPADMDDLAVADDDVVELVSAHSAIRAIVRSDDTLRRGTVSMSHSYGVLPGEDDVERSGSNTGRLIDTTGPHDPYTGQPRMTNIPIRVVPAGRRSPAPAL